MIFYDNRLIKGRSKVTDALWAGPYKVVAQVDNDISCIHVGLDTPHTLHAGDVKLFVGSMEQAQRVARFDGEQHVVTSVKGHRGSHHDGRRLGLEY